MIYIDNGKTVIEYHTNRKIDKAVQTLLNEIEDLIFAESVECMKVEIVEKGEQE